MDAKDRGRCYHYTHRTRVSEHDPQANPAQRSAYVNWVAHISVKTDHDQALGRGEWCWASTSRPGEIPNAPKGDREAEHGRDGCEPAPTCSARNLDRESEPALKQPEPEGEPPSARRQRRACCQPSPH